MVTPVENSSTEGLGAHILDLLATCDHGALSLRKIEDVALLVNQPWPEIRVAIEALLESHLISWDPETGRLCEGGR